jgi:hypothetical protein
MNCPDSPGRKIMGNTPALMGGETTAAQLAQQRQKCCYDVKLSAVAMRCADNPGSKVVRSTRSIGKGSQVRKHNNGHSMKFSWKLCD